MPRQRVSPWFAFFVALAMNLSNLFEPLTVDDACHSYYAAQVAKDPLHPFEFEIDWHQKPVAAWDVMVAPVTSYYLAPAIAWFGDDTVLWKAWFLPLQWLWCASVLALLRAIVRRHAELLLVALALGCAVLPGINLMLEVPMQAYAFASLAVLLRAMVQKSMPLASVAGVLLGLALQTKYSAIGFCGPWCLFAWWRGRWREPAVGLLVALAVALGIEWWIGTTHGGGSYFLRQLELTQLRDWPHLLKGMVMHVGALGFPAAVLALFAAGVPRSVPLSLTGLGVAALVVIAAVPDRDARSALDLALDSLAYGSLVIVTWIVLGGLGWRLVSSGWQRLRRGNRAAAVRLLLPVWLCGEVAASLLVSPFPAARRSMLVVLVFTVAVGWLVARRRGAAKRVRHFAWVSAVLGFACQGVDWLDSRAVVTAAEQAVAHARSVDPNARVLFTGGWGFEYYAPRVGMQPLSRGRTEVRAGDFVVVGSVDGAEEPWFDWRSEVWTQKVDQQAHEIGIGDAVPFSLQLNYYSGRRSIDGQNGPRFVVWVFRVREGFQARELVPVVNPWRDH